MPSGQAQLACAGAKSARRKARISVVAIGLRTMKTRIRSYEFNSSIPIQAVPRHWQRSVLQKEWLLRDTIRITYS